MKYIEVNVHVEDQNIRDVLTAQLTLLGYDSFVEDDESLKSYIAENEYDEPALVVLLNELLGVHHNFSIAEIPDINWNASWESDYKPVKVDQDVIVRAPFHDPDPSINHDIIIKPQMSFGTGHHETTYLMISGMLKLDFTGKDVLDMGCGTGVLAILANKLEARSVIAIDNDEWAYNNSLSNVKMNKADNIQVIQGDRSDIPDGPFSIILANINRNILLDQIPDYKRVLDSNGSLLLSGIYEKDLPLIQSKCSGQGLILVEHQIRNNWVSALFKEGQTE